MEKPGKISLNFLSHFVEKRRQNSFYSKIVNSISGTVVHENTSKRSYYNNLIYDIQDVPGYLKVFNTPMVERWRISKILTYKGTMIVLNNYQNVNDYLTIKFSSNKRSKFRTYKKRLENSFDITYKTYCGEISLSEYEFLFDEFKKLMINRFEQKQTLNKDLEQWEIYREIGYPLILKKEACLFVIYDGLKPISICFNIIYDKIIFAYIRAYDIDYAKFYIGFTDLIHQLQWCFENKFEIFDMLKGDYEYKSHWTDDEYFFERHIIYGSGLSLTTSLAWFKIIKLRLFYKMFHFLNKWNIHLFYRKLKNICLTKSGKKNSINRPRVINIENYATPPANLKIETIDIRQNNFSFLRKFVYDYIYTNCESVNDIKVSKIMGHPYSYLIRGSKGCRKITIAN